MDPKNTRESETQYSPHLPRRESQENIQPACSRLYLQFNALLRAGGLKELQQLLFHFSQVEGAGSAQQFIDNSF